MAYKKGIFEYLGSLQKDMKDQYWVAKNKYIEYFDTLPIDPKCILLEGEFATKLDGNMFYIARQLSSNEKYRGYKIYLSSWGRYIDTMQAKLDYYGITNVQILLYSSDEYMRVLASAKYLFNDVTFPSFFIKKKGQVYLNTWHGTPLKAMGKSMGDDILIGNVQKNLVDSDILLYPNEYTKEHMLEDYMIKNISRGRYVISGYPRNEAFFDSSRIDIIKKEQGIEGKKIYAYMPTWRGTTGNVGTSQASAYMLYYLSEIDKRLRKDEILYVNLHPLEQHAASAIETDGFEHIRMFPKEYEVYDFLNIADVLVTDYSSVFFDFACTRRKIVLFPFDKEKYLAGRGMYMSLDELPFPQAFDEKQLIRELRSPKAYDDSEFLKTFCPCDGPDASEKLCDLFILKRNRGLKFEKVPDNGKENVLLYAGTLEKNGMTTSLRSLLNTVDLTKKNYYISFCHSKAKDNIEQLRSFNKNVNYFAVADYFNYSFKDRAFKSAFYSNKLPAGIYMKAEGKRNRQNFIRSYGHARFDKVIQFCGYETNMILLYSEFKGKKAIFVHNDMVSEIKSKGNQRADVLRYAYKKYDVVAAVSEDIVPPTLEVSRGKGNIKVVKNTIDYKTILGKAELPIELDEKTLCSVDREEFFRIMQSDAPKFLNIGRYSPEKGHRRLVRAFRKFSAQHPDAYLIIMGGYSTLGNGYEELAEKVKEMGLADKVILLFSVSNPYPIIKACDYFIMSSFYEGLPMVLFEADLLGLPIAATDVKGPHGFLTRYNGTLVDNSTQGVYDGLSKLWSGEAKQIGIDYEAFNKECVKEFEELFD